MLCAIVASTIVAAPLAEARRGGKQARPATARVQSKRSVGERKHARSVAPLLGATRAKVQAVHAKARIVAPKARVAREIVSQGMRGVIIDGPRHTGRAIRKNPVKFVLGTVAIGAIGALGTWFGFDGSSVAAAISAVAVAAQVKLSWPALRKARGPALARRIGADVIWPTALFLGSWGIGHSIIGGEHAHAPHTTPTPADLGTSFVSSSIIGGDAPAVAVTALDTARGGDGAAH